MAATHAITRPRRSRHRPIPPLGVPTPWVNRKSCTHRWRRTASAHHGHRCWPARRINASPTRGDLGAGSRRPSRAAGRSVRLAVDVGAAPPPQPHDPSRRRPQRRQYGGEHDEVRPGRLGAILHGVVEPRRRDGVLHRDDPCRDDQGDHRQFDRQASSPGAAVHGLTGRTCAVRPTSAGTGDVATRSAANSMPARLSR